MYICTYMYTCIYIYTYIVNIPPPRMNYVLKSLFFTLYLYDLNSLASL